MLSRGWLWLTLFCLVGCASKPPGPSGMQVYELGENGISERFLTREQLWKIPHVPYVIQEAVRDKQKMVSILHDAVRAEIAQGHTMLEIVDFSCDDVDECPLERQRDIAESLHQLLTPQIKRGATIHLYAPVGRWKDDEKKNPFGWREACRRVFNSLRD